MKIVHISDTHLGWRGLHYVDPLTKRNQREQDFFDVFTEAIEKAIEMRPAAVLHSGDLFDSYHPSSAALAVCLDAVERLRDADIPFVVISGNHSTPRVASAEHVFAVLDRFGGVHAVYREPRVIDLDGLRVYAVPHHNDRDVLEGWMREARPPGGSDRTVLMAHTGLDGLSQMVGPEAASMFLPAEALQGAGEFDYIALGHLHKHKGARNNGAWAGSLDRVSWADDAKVKGFVVVDLDADRGSRTFLRLEPVSARPHITIPDFDAADSEDLTAALTQIAESRSDLEGAVVRLVVCGVSAAEWAAVDLAAVNGAFGAALHVELEARLMGGSRAGAGAAADLREFLSSRVPKGMDADDFIGRAEVFIAQAEEELIT